MSLSVPLDPQLKPIANLSQASGTLVSIALSFVLLAIRGS
jgi:hypothetical protein